MATIAIRFIQIKTVLGNKKNYYLLPISETKRDYILLLNKYSVIVSLITSIAMFLLASTRVSELFEIHILLAIVVFVSEPFVFLFQTIISFYMRPVLNTNTVAYIRIFITVFASIDGIVFGLSQIWQNVFDINTRYRLEINYEI